MLLSPKCHTNMKPSSATATARANIALSKYWGKSDVQFNLPAVPSISLTLDGFETTTTVTFDPKLKKDSVVINRKVTSNQESARVSTLLDRVRNAGGKKYCARVQSVR